MKSPSAVGGAERLAVDIPILLDPDRFERYLVSTGPSNGPLRIDDLRAAGVTYVPMARAFRFDPRAWVRLVRLLRRERIDVVHAHLFGANLWAAVLGWVARVPVVIAHEHTWSYEGERVRRFVDRNVIARLCDRVLTVSEEDRRKMRDVVGIPDRKIIVVENGVSVGSPTGQTSIRAELGIPADAPVIAVVALLRSQKRHDRLVEAAAILRQEFPDIRVLVVGGRDGREDLAPGLRAQIDAAGLAENVLLLGSRLDVPDILQEVDIGVLSSDFEGSPLAIMEYMACGLPTVSTPVGGVPALVHDGETGLLSEEVSAPALAGAIATLLRDPEERRRMGANAKELFESRYTMGPMVERVSEIYEELFAASGAS